MTFRRFDQRPSGIPGTGPLPSGSHFCVFEAAPQELLEVLVPYVRAGLEANELCAWAVHPPLSFEVVRAALAEAVPGLDHHLTTGQLEIVSPGAPPEALERKLDRAVLAGFEGVRLVVSAGAVGDVRELAASVRRLRIIAALLYPRAELGAVGLMEVVQEHRFALLCDAGRWELLQGSEVRTARDALERSEEKLQSLFRNMSEGFAYHRILLDGDGRPCDYIFLEVSPAFERMTGLAAPQIIGKRVTQVLPGIESDPTSWIGKYGRVALTGEPAHFEAYAAPLDRWYEISAWSPQRGHFGVTITDITDRKHAEEQRRAAESALMASRARFELLSETAGKLLASDDPQGLVNELCKAVMAHLDCAAFFNYLVDETSGRLRLNACAGIPDEEARRIEWLDLGVAVCGCVARDGRRIVAEDIQGRRDPRTELVRRYGIQVYCCHPLLAQGRVMGTLSFGADNRKQFTADEVALMQTVANQVAVAMQRVQSQQALTQANSQLVESDRRKNEFLAVLSHELRNPLAPIANSLYVLRRAAPGGDQAQRARLVIERQVDQLTHLVNDLLDVTRISRNKIHLQRELLDLGDVVKGSVEDQRSLFDRNELQLELELPSGRVTVSADRTRLAQVVSNLLQNAVKFTPHRGLVRVAVTVEEGGQHALVRVSDNGVGMTPDTLRCLFQPFMQADKTLDRTKGGLGLGLALVKGLVELHGGQVTAHSDGVGRGAELTVRLPVSGGGGSELHVAAPVPRRVRRRVLIIEDSVDAADSLREVLEVGDHEVVVAHSGPEGLALARGFRPDAVLCDIGLPRMDGYDVARAFRSDDELRHTFLVALTGYALPEDLQRASAAGFDSHLSKPPDLARLETLLEALRS